jgi:hypothetical protein
MRNRCPRCGIGYLVPPDRGHPDYGRAGRVCTHEPCPGLTDPVGVPTARIEKASDA